MGITVEVRGDQKFQDIRRAIERLADQSLQQELLESIGAVVESQTRRRISSEKSSPAGEKWQDWSDSYAKTRHSNQSLLQGNGDLLDSIQYPRHKLAGDDVLDLLDAGQPVMTPKICRAELLDIALTELIPAGLVEDFEDYKDTLDVTIDSKDPNRLNFICHPNLVNQLRVLAGLIQFKL